MGVYQHQGMLLQNLHHRYLYVVIRLSHLKDLDQKIPSFPNCDNYRICRASNPNPLNDNTRTNDNELHQQLCGTFKIDYLQEMDIITKVKARLEHKINITLPALLPNKLIGDSRGPVTSSDELGQDKLCSRNKRYESALDDTLIGIENLNSGYLTHHILDPQVLTKYLEIIEDDLEETAPEYEPVFTCVYQYYGNSLASFTNTIDDLLLPLPILIKLKVQVPMSLFSIETVPVSLDAETYIGDKREYTQIIPETKYIALTDNNYVPLTQAQISLCAKIGYTYNCEYAHLLKKCTEHTCMSTIYYDQESKIKANQCKTTVTFDNTPKSKILDAGNILILPNLQKPLTIACKDVSRVFEIEYSTYHILNRSELCKCSLTAGNYLLSQSDTNCGDMPEARDSYFTTYYAFNKIILDAITVKFDIQVDDKTITQSTLLHDDIPGYNLPTLEFVLPQ